MSVLQVELLKAALAKVEAHSGKDKAWKDKYTTWVRRLPGLIQTSGLAQTIAFAEEKAKKEDPVRQLLLDLQSTPGIGGPLLSKAKTANLQEYSFLTQRLLESIVYYKRFAVSILGGEEERA